MLGQPRAADAAAFSHDLVANRGPRELHPLNGQNIAVKWIGQLEKTLDIFI